jgi:N6-L-threonylcarbamoyladenine synthase
MGAACEAEGFELYFPELKYCGDNGAMIACAGYYAYKDGIRGDSSLNAKATLSLEEYSGLIGKKNENS